MHIEVAFFVMLLVVVAFFVVLYFVVRAAVRDGILAARHAGDGAEPKEGEGISQIACPACGDRHDMDYPKCPTCKHRY